MPSAPTPFRHYAIAAAILAAFALGSLATWAVLSDRGAAGGDADDVEETVVAPQRLSVVNGETVITLDPATQRRDGIGTATLRNTTAHRALRAYGAVLELKSLTDLASAYAGAQAQAEAARARLSASRSAFERARGLYRDQQNVSAAQLQSAEAAFRSDEAAYAAARSATQTLVTAAREQWGPALVDALMRRSPLFTRLTSRQRVLLQLTLRPDQSTDLSAGASVELPDGKLAPLELVSAAARTDPRIQGSSYFYTAPAATGLLPGMSVSALMPLASTVRGVVVPFDAVVWTQGQAWAFFRTGASSFVRRPVPDRTALATGYVVQGEPDGVQVVVRGAQMLLSEEFRAEARVSD